MCCSKTQNKKCRCYHSSIILIIVLSAIGNAFSVLSDPEKRRRYDQYGSEDERVSHRHSRRGGYYDYDYSRGFEGDLETL